MARVTRHQHPRLHSLLCKLAAWQDDDPPTLEWSDPDRAELLLADRTDDQIDDLVMRDVAYLYRDAGPEWAAFVAELTSPLGQPS